MRFRITQGEFTASIKGQSISKIQAVPEDRGDSNCQIRITLENGVVIIANSYASIGTCDRLEHEFDVFIEHPGPSESSYILT